MRLLSKNEVQRDASDEKRRQIEEGAKLAQKVDSLRQLQSTEQANLLKFRDESLKKVREDLEALSSEKQAIASEIESLRKERLLLKKPLDLEWEKLEERKLALSETESALEDRKSALLSKEKELDRESKRLVLEAKRMEDKAMETSKKLSLAEIALKEAEEQSNLATDLKKKADEYHASKIKNLILLETEVKARERDTDNRSTYLANKESELNKRERFVNDKYQTLERTLKRLNK